MEKQATQSILTVALMAAFADGLKDEREREAIRKLAETLGADGGVDLPALYREVLLSKPKLEDVVAPLGDPALRQYAYEMAVGIANADGAQNTRRRRFPGPAGAGPAVACRGAPNRLARSASDLAAAATEPATAAPAAAAAAVAASGTVLGKANVSEAEIDKTILTASITNAALELLPESLASMAIIPLQMRLVYRIGKAYGYEMDSTHAKDFIATLGVGLTSQYVEQFGRKLLGGLLGGLGGGIGRTVGRQAASSGLTFATTYAIGRVAQRYYAGGRTLDSATLKQTFSGAAGRGARDGAAVPGADRAGREDDRHPQPAVDGPPGLRPARRAWNSRVRDRLVPVRPLEVRDRVEAHQPGRRRVRPQDLGHAGVADLQVELDRGVGIRAEHRRRVAADDPARTHHQHPGVARQSGAGRGHAGVDPRAEIRPALERTQRSLLTRPALQGAADRAEVAPAVARGAQCLQTLAFKGLQQAQVVEFIQPRVLQPRGGGRQGGLDVFQGRDLALQRPRHHPVEGQAIGGKVLAEPAGLACAQVGDRVVVAGEIRLAMADEVQVGHGVGSLPSAGGRETDPCQAGPDGPVDPGCNAKRIG